MSDHAISNAKAHANSISKGIEALRILQEGEAETVEYDGEDFTDENSLRERMQESALSGRGQERLDHAGMRYGGGRIHDPAIHRRASLQDHRAI